MRATVSLLVLCLLPAVLAAASKGRAPTWLSTVAQTETPAFARNADAVVLLQDSSRRVASDGKITATTRRVVRILKLDGRDKAQAAVPYASGHEKITSFDAWLLSPDGNVRAYTRKEAVDIAQDVDEVYTEARVLVLSVASSVEAGAVFAYACTVEERSIFSQDIWPFQELLPVVLSRVAYELPTDWTIKGTMFAHDPVAPLIEGNRYTWELRDLPAVPDEVWGPDRSNLAATVALDLRPTERAALRTAWRIFDTWQDVARYEAELHDPRALPDAAIAAKTQELIAGTASSFDQIKVIGHYVAKVNYASIQQALGRGGGHTPNTAAQVFKRHYGDCKDKTVLMRAMLAAAGVRSYSAIAFAQERRAINESWPSPFQFNHCVVAIAVDDTITSPAIVEHPEFGRLMIYDPTNSLAPPGELLPSQQGSRVLVGGGTAHDLIKLPSGEPEANRLDRHLDARLEANGSITATVTEHSVGSAAMSACSEYRRATAAQYSAIVQRWIARGARAARIGKVEVEDRVTEVGQFDLRVEFSLQNFAQSMGGQLLVFKPTVVPRRAHTALTERERKTPVILLPATFTETIDLELPPGFVVDEMPSPVEITRPFAEFSLVGEIKDGRLLFRRLVRVRAAEIPVDRYEEVRSFYDGINRADQTPVVLKRK